MSFPKCQGYIETVWDARLISRGHHDLGKGCIKKSQCTRFLNGTVVVEDKDGDDNELAILEAKIEFVPL